ncbi:MAG: C39 family peptidase [Humidesulfovibrio sp.]|nr:C39 family peptidase [Humidesulfovibrio sp.]
MKQTDRPVPGIAARAVFFLLLALSLAACAAQLPPDFSPPAIERVLDHVPFHPQEAYQCGPSSLATVLGYYGDPVSPEDVAAEVFRPDLRGAVSLDLALYPRGRGFRTRFFRGSAADIAAAVDAGRPVLVMADYGFGGMHKFHYMVITGYGPQGVRVNSGRLRAQWIPWRRFFSDWDGADRWTLLVEPGGPARKRAE